jgi:hypothetical protein
VTVYTLPLPANRNDKVLWRHLANIARTRAMAARGSETPAEVNVLDDDEPRLRQKMPATLDDCRPRVCGANFNTMALLLSCALISLVRCVRVFLLLSTILSERSRRL